MTSPLVSCSGILIETADVKGRRIGCVKARFLGGFIDSWAAERLIQVEEQNAENCRREDMLFPVSGSLTFKDTQSEPGKTE